MASHKDVVQASLSEDLFFLGKSWPSSRRTRNPFASQQELVLNALALYMTTGRPDGVIATFFHETPFTLYLAKSGPLSHEDAGMVTSFFTCLKDATGFTTLLPFLARYSAENVEKRVRNLCRSFKEIFPSLSDIVLEHQLENTALESLKSLLGSSFTFNNTAEAHVNFKGIVTASKKLLKIFLFFESALASKYGNARLSRLKRHLLKVVQYRDVKQLIRFIQRNNSKITVLWIPDMIPRPISLNTGTLADRHLDTFLAGAIKGIGEVERADLRERMATTLSYFEQTLDVNLLVHPEIRLITYLTDVVGVQSQYPPGTELYIGSGKRICGCCDRWIKAFNKCLTVKWTTTFGNNQMRYDWRIPDPDLMRYIQDAVRQANDAVLEGVKCGMEEKLFKELDYAQDSLLYNRCCGKYR